MSYSSVVPPKAMPPARPKVHAPAPAAAAEPLAPKFSAELMKMLAQLVVLR